MKFVMFDWKLDPDPSAVHPIAKPLCFLNYPVSRECTDLISLPLLASSHRTQIDACHTYSAKFGYADEFRAFTSVRRLGFALTCVWDCDTVGKYKRLKGTLNKPQLSKMRMW
jgi:hypothetical protein